jgi:hypothetical protein
MELNTLDCSTFQNALIAHSRAATMPEEADIYGFLVGAWELEIIHYMTDVKSLGLKADVTCARILEGHAIQDTWISRPHGCEPDGIPRMCGTTLRVWNPATKTWRVTWTNVLSGARNELVARRVGNDIVQIGTHADGTPIRWLFSDLTNDSFHWTGEALGSDGSTWTLQGEFHARRIS